jgi:hypothetical protein
MKTTSVSCRLNEETRKALERAAESDMRTVGSLVGKIVTLWLRENGHLEK